MNTIRSVNQWSSKIAIALLAILFWFAMNYVGRNMGGGGIQLPFNNYAWITVAFLVLLGIIRASLFSQVKLSRTYLYYVVFVVLLLLPLTYTNRLFLDVEALRLYGVAAGLLFVFVLQQFNSVRFKRQLLLAIFISCVIQSAWGLVQYYFIFESHFLFYRADYGQPYGVFQQVNDFVSYITVGSLIAIYYCFSSPLTSRVKAFAVALLLFSNFHLAQLANADTASVVARIVVPCYLLYWLVKKRMFKLSALFLVASLLGTAMPKAWFDIRPSNVAAANVQQPSDANAISQSSDSTSIVENKNKQVSASEEKKFLQGKVSEEHKFGTRETIYQVALTMFLDKPWLGHGIGTFTKQYLLYQGEYLKQNPDAPAEFNIHHPHNEVFFWIIELGVGALVAFLFLLGAWIYLARKQQINVQLLLLTSPIVLHSMLELPMYHSAPHYLLFLSLLFVSDSSRSIKLSIPKLSKVVVLPAAFYSFFQIQVFLLSTMYALNMFLHFNASQREQVQYLLQVQNPAAFKLRFEFELFQHKLRTAARTKKISQKDVTSFIYWAYSVTQYKPLQSTYENFIEALRLIGKDEAALKYANEATLMYPFNEKLVRYQRELMNKLSKPSKETVSNVQG